MAWEYRRGAGPYYTRSLRRNGKVVRQYIGRGLVAEAAARLDAEAREARQDLRARLQAERASLARLRSALLDLRRQLDDLTSAALFEAGYHEHRGQWRRSAS